MTKVRVRVRFEKNQKFEFDLSLQKLQVLILDSVSAAPTFSKIVKKISPILNKKNYYKYSKNEASQ